MGREECCEEGRGGSRGGGGGGGGGLGGGGVRVRHVHSEWRGRCFASCPVIGTQRGDISNDYNDGLPHDV